MIYYNASSNKFILTTFKTKGNNVNGNILKHYKTGNNEILNYYGLPSIDKPITDFVYERINEDQLVEKLNAILSEETYIEATDILTAVFLDYSSELIGEYMKNIENPYRSNRASLVLQAKADVAQILLNMQKEADQKLMEEITKLVTE